MKTLFFALLLSASSMLHAQHGDIAWGISNGPAYFLEDIGQFDLEVFFHKRNSLVFGVGLEHSLLNLENVQIGYIDDDDESLRFDEEPREGVKFDLLHKFYLPLKNESEEKDYGNYYSMFLMHGVMFQAQENEYYVEVWKQYPDGLSRLNEGTIYDYIYYYNYMAGIGLQMLTNNKKFCLEYYFGLRYQYADIQKSDYSPVEYDAEFYEPGYTGFKPQLLVKIGFYFLRKSARD